MVLPAELESHALSRLADQADLCPVPLAALQRRGLRLWLRRDDRLGSVAAGNKLYKLWFNLQRAQVQGAAVVSFGGNYSNHLHALAHYGRQYSIPTIGIVRGHRPTREGPTLRDLRDNGMLLRFVSRSDYRHLCQHSDDLPERWRQRLQLPYAKIYCVPEGGANILGVVGCRHLGVSIRRSIQSHCLDPARCTVCLPCGTASTFAGVVAGLQDTSAALGFSVLKGEDRLTSAVDDWLQQLGLSYQRWSVVTDYHCGGYARFPAYLQRFLQRLELSWRLELDPVYTVKMLWGIVNLARQGYWQSGSQILAVHTGGLQGRRGYFG